MKFLIVFVNTLFVLLSPIWSLPYLIVGLLKGELTVLGKKFFWE